MIFESFLQSCLKKNFKFGVVSSPGSMPFPSLFMSNSLNFLFLFKSFKTFFPLHYKSIIDSAFIIIEINKTYFYIVFSIKNDFSVKLFFQQGFLISNFKCYYGNCRRRWERTHKIPTVVYPDIHIGHIQEFS